MSTKQRAASRARRQEMASAIGMLLRNSSAACAMVYSTGPGFVVTPTEAFPPHGARRMGVYSCDAPLPYLIEDAAFVTRGAENDPPPHRNREIVAMRRRGISLGKIAKLHGITKQRVAQIVRRVA